MSMPIHQKRGMSMLSVRETLNGQDVTLWHVCKTHGRVNMGTCMRGAFSEGGCRVVTAWLLEGVRGQWTRRTVSSVVCSWPFAAKAMTSERSGRRDEGM